MEEEMTRDKLPLSSENDIKATFNEVIKPKKRRIDDLYKDDKKKKFKLYKDFSMKNFRFCVLGIV